MEAKLIKKKLKLEPFIFQAKQHNLPEYHYHNINQILYVLKGNGKLLLNNTYYNIKALDLIILNTGTPHKFFPNTPETMILYIIEFSNEFLLKLNNGKLMKEFLESLKNTEKIISTNIAGLLSVPMILKRMLFEIQHKHIEYNSILTIKLLEILALLKRYIKEKEKLLKLATKKRTASEERVWQVIQYIKNNYYEKITLPLSAKMAALSQRQFSRLFQQITNMSFKEFLNNIRIEKAKQLLKTTNKEIISVCFEVGFDDLSYFYKVFKKETNLTPKMFIKKL